METILNLYLQKKIKMNFLLIGHAVVDKIIDTDHTLKQPGGIFYSLVGFISQMEKDDKLYLCSTIDKQHKILFNDAFGYVQKDFVEFVDSIPQVELVINKNGEREENYSAMPLNLDIPLNGLDKFDGILINMISGNDLSLKQIKELRINYKGLIYFDVHTFSRGVDKNLRRLFRRINNFDEWAKCIDILQANELELKTLSDHKSEKNIVEELFSYGIKQIIVTRSERGATVFTKENKKTKELHKDALKLKSVNKVGCGDIFGAAYFYSYIKNKNIPVALEGANMFAGVATTYSDAHDLLNLKNDVHERFSTK